MRQEKQEEWGGLVVLSTRSRGYSSTRTNGSRKGLKMKVFILTLRVFASLAIWLPSSL